MSWLAARWRTARRSRNALSRSSGSFVRPRTRHSGTETEKLLRSVLIAGYLEPMRSHEEAANKLMLSRAAYFRRLRTAVERLAEHMAGGAAPADVA